MGFLLHGCEAGRHLTKDQLLLRNDPKYKGNKHLSSEVLAEGVITKANKRLLVPKLYLHLYNFGKSLEADTSFAKQVYRRADTSYYYEKQLTHWLVDVVGEPPTLLSPRQVNADARNLESIYFGEGFLNAFVQPVVKRVKRDPQKVDLTFEITEGDAYIIRNVRFFYRDTLHTPEGEEFPDSLQQKTGNPSATQDSTIIRLLQETADLSLLKPGNRFREATLTNERVRIANFMKDQGYYTFGPEQVFFIIDTLRSEVFTEGLTKLESLPDSVNPLQTPDVEIDTAEVSLGLQEAQRQMENDLIQENRARPKYNERTKQIVGYSKGEHPFDIEVIVPDTARVYYVDSVFVSIRQAGETSTEGDVQFNLLNPAAGIAFGVNQRTIRPDYDINFITNEFLARSLNLGVIAERIRQRPGIRYSRTEALLTQNQLQTLGLFRNAIISFSVVPGTNKLHAYVDCVLLRNFTTAVGVEAFISDDKTLQSNLPGLGVSFKLGIQNLFSRAEQLNLSSNGFISFFSPGDGQPVQSFFQSSSQASLVFPRFLFVEGFFERNLLRFRPRTTFSLTYFQEQRDIFQRANLTASWQYQWYNLPNSQRSQMNLTPLSITWVQSIKNEPGFSEEIAEVDTSLRALILRDFTPRLATKTSFSYTYSADYGQSRIRDTWFFRGGIDVGGNIPYLIDAIGKSDGNKNDNLIGGEFQYAQFVRLSLEGRYDIPTGLKSDLIFRLFVGGGLAWNNTPALPFENRFFSGGASSVRGWLSGTLGPGTFQSDTVRINNLIAPGGEYIVEANVEYRYALTDLLQIALFLDAGNVWFATEEGFNDRRAAFLPENLELGVAAGFGLRFDLSFFIFRFDIGQQIYAPDVQRIITRGLKDLGASRAQFNIGIGYPF